MHLQHFAANTDTNCQFENQMENQNLTIITSGSTVCSIQANIITMSLGPYLFTMLYLNETFPPYHFLATEQLTLIGKISFSLNNS